MKPRQTDGGALVYDVLFTDDFLPTLSRYPVMGYQPLPQKQLFTVGQIVAAISIVACLVFIVSYSGRIIMDKKVQARQEQMKQGVDEAKAFGVTIQEKKDNIDSPEVVDPYARTQRNMELPGEQAVVPLVIKNDSSEQAQQANAAETSLQGDESVANWRLWWDFVISGGDRQ